MSGLNFLLFCFYTTFASGLCSAAPENGNEAIGKSSKAHCTVDSDFVATCDYETLCSDGETLFIVAAEREAELEEATANWKVPLNEIAPELERQSHSESIEYFFSGDGKKAVTPRTYLDTYAFTSWEQMQQSGPIDWLPNGTKFVHPEHQANLYHFATIFMPVWSDVVSSPDGSVYFVNTEQHCLGEWKKMVFRALVTQAEGLLSEEQMSEWLDSMPQRRHDLPKPRSAVLTRDHVWGLPGGQETPCELQTLKRREPFTVCAHHARTFGVRSFVLGGYRDHATLRKALGVSERPRAERSKSPIITVIDRQDREGNVRALADPEGIMEALQELPAYLNASVRYHPAMPVDPYDQVRLMAETDVLVMTVGAGLTNAIFLSQNSAVVQLYPYGILRFPYFSEPISRAGMKYREVFGVVSEEFLNRLEEIGPPYDQCVEDARRIDSPYHKKRMDQDHVCHIYAWLLGETLVEPHLVREAVHDCILSLGHFT
uniref:Glycosyltransferase 61 catalytic domain-containing protein n=1 Tax=Chromera velia CCMP2878 TaxID=1169474 RepID=A0A0G4FF13_9ALVE|eukprot:Cvel_16660.t1-p1 / transcript=Cvel_16660.t1 / gene=Cvel_16660 / organism=Chromera_velia_CCMP2878 / gene_product=hypothetical protein / transcript_product=hypothetical protein / location=Cvel_scaffold1292:31279-32736(+) / protein_length=486 / sequence_SO=supercontig / SO=protein_coding / is_pseudo=false